MTPMTDTKPTEITLSREIAAPVSRVWALWTDPARVTQWFGLKGSEALSAGWDVRPGGAWHLESRLDGGQRMRIEGIFTAVEPGKRLVKSWWSVGPDGARGNETEVEIRFEPGPAGCRVTVIHRGIRHTPELFEAGWSHTLDVVSCQLSGKF
ncbi:MAG: SRPBCC domain-containing protein [Pseudomonadota bacterium]